MRTKTNADLMMNYTKKPPVDIAASRVKRTVGISAYDSPQDIKDKLARDGVDVSGLRVRPLTYEEIQDMRGTPEELYHMHPQGNEGNYNFAIEKHDQVIAEIRADDKKTSADGLVTFFTELNDAKRNPRLPSQVSAEFLGKITSTVKAFAEKYPQFRADSTAERVRANYESALAYISNALLDPTIESSWATALTELARRGHIVINDGAGNLLSGQALAEHDNLPDLLLPVQTRAQKKAKRTRDEISRMSADEFRESRTPEEQEDIERGRYMPGVYDKYKANREAETDKQRDKEMSAFLALNPNWPGDEVSSRKVLELLEAWNERLSAQSLQACYNHLRNIGEITSLQSGDQRWGNAHFIFGDAPKVHHHGQTIPQLPEAETGQKSFVTWTKNHDSRAYKERVASDPEFRAWADSEE